MNKEAVIKDLVEKLQQDMQLQSITFFEIERHSRRETKFLFLTGLAIGVVIGLIIGSIILL